MHLVHFERVSELQDGRHFRARMVHLFSLLHAVTMAYLRSDWQFVEGINSIEEYDPFGLRFDTEGYLTQESLERAMGAAEARRLLRRRAESEAQAAASAEAKSARRPPPIYLQPSPLDSQESPRSGARGKQSPKAGAAPPHPASCPNGRLSLATAARVTLQMERKSQQAQAASQEARRRLSQPSLLEVQAQSGLTPFRFCLSNMFYCSDPTSFAKQAQNNKFNVIGGISEAERAALEASLAQDRVFLVVSWIFELMVKRVHEGGLPVGAPILSRTYQVLSDGHLGYFQASKVADTPFPFPYVQLVSLLLVIFNTIAPLVIASFVGTFEEERDIAHPYGLVLIVCLSFFVSLGYTALNEVARELEEPYGFGPNHLPLVQFQEQWNSRILHLLLPDADRGVPDDPFIGTSTAGLSAEEKKRRRTRFGTEEIPAAIILAQAGIKTLAEEQQKEVLSPKRSSTLRRSRESASWTPGGFAEAR